MTEREALKSEINSYYEQRGAEAARLALKLAKSYLTCEAYARYAYRLDVLDSWFQQPKFIFETGPDDSYVNVMARLGFDEFERWVAQKLYAGDLGTGWINEEKGKEIFEVLKTTPKRVVIDMHQPLLFIARYRLSFYDDFDKKMLVEVKKRFEEKKTKLERAVAVAQQWK